MEEMYFWPDRLKRCPFCGGTASVKAGLNHYYAICDECGVDGPVVGSQREVERAWNSRPSDLVYKLECLQDELLSISEGFYMYGKEHLSPLLSEAESKIVEVIRELVQERRAGG